MAVAWSYSESTNTATVTGGLWWNPATPASFVTADRANSAVLLAATACTTNMTLTYSVRPVEKRALQITFTLAGTSAGAGDTLDITGTDWNGDAQTESIDVSAGNGAYTGTKKWRTITDIDCTGWSDGTLKVEQPIWGVIWEYNSNTFGIACKLNVGNGSDATYFAAYNNSIIFLDGVATSSTFTFIYVRNEATCQFGGLNDAPTKRTYGGSNVSCSESTYNFTYFVELEGNTSVLNCYSSRFECASKLQYLYCSDVDSVSRVWNCVFENVSPWLLGENSDIFNVTIATSLDCFNPAACGIDKMVFISGNRALFTNGSTTARGLYARGTAVSMGCASWSDATVNMIDCDFDNWDTRELGGTVNFYRQYSFNLIICDYLGNAVEDVAIDCYDKDGNAVWTPGSVTSNSSGEITEQNISYKRYYYSGGQAEETYSPHTFKIYKKGYITLTINNITVDRKLVWRLELQNVLNNNFSDMAIINYG